MNDTNTFKVNSIYKSVSFQGCGHYGVRLYKLNYNSDQISIWEDIVTRVEYVVDAKKTFPHKITTRNRKHYMFWDDVEKRPLSVYESKDVESVTISEEDKLRSEGLFTIYSDDEVADADVIYWLNGKSINDEVKKAYLKNFKNKVTELSKDKSYINIKNCLFELTEHSYN